MTATYLGVCFHLTGLDTYYITYRLTYERVQHKGLTSHATFFEGHVKKHDRKTLRLLLVRH